MLLPAQQLVQHTQDDDRDICELWHALDVGIWHGMACRCSGAASPSLCRADIETTLLEYLQMRYEGLKRETLSAVVQSRQNGSEGEFIQWLTSVLARQDVSSQDRELLKSDLLTFLRSLQRPRGFGYKSDL